MKQGVQVSFWHDAFHHTKNAIPSFNSFDKVCLIALHDLTDGIVNLPLPQGAISNLPQRQVLPAGDVLPAAHDGFHLPVVLAAPAAPCVACAPLWVIRIHDPAHLLPLPPYLVWYLQTRIAQKMPSCLAF